MAIYRDEYQKRNSDIKTWKSIDKANEVEVEEWLFYTNDKYFGRVVEKADSKVKLLIVNFRNPEASYCLWVTDLNKLKKCPQEVLVDPQIEQFSYQIYRSLERAFSIWKKLEEYVVESQNYGLQRKQVLPVLFREFGQIFGKWAGSGYLTKNDIVILNTKEFILQVSRWKLLKELALDESIDEKILVAIDILKEQEVNSAKKWQHLEIAHWFMLQAEYFEYTKENCSHLQQEMELITRTLP